MTSKTCTGILITLIVGLVVGCSTGSVTKEQGDALFKKAQAGSASAQDPHPLRLPPCQLFQ